MYSLVWFYLERKVNFKFQFTRISTWICQIRYHFQ